MIYHNSTSNSTLRYYKQKSVKERVLLLTIIASAITSDQFHSCRINLDISTIRIESCNRRTIITLESTNYHERKKKQRFTSIEKYTNRLTETKWHDELRSCTLVHGALYAITCNLIFAPRERVHYLSRHPARLHPFARTSMIILPGLMHRVAKCSMRFKCRGIVKYPVYGS